MSLPNKFKSKWWIEVAALAAISALVYLISINRFSLYRDDWYYAMDRTIGERHSNGNAGEAPLGRR